MYTCGYNDSGQCGVGRTGRVTKLREVQALRGKPVVQVYSSNGCEHLAAVTQDGELFTCGYNARGQLGLGSTTQVSTPRVVEGTLYNRRVVLVACSYYHTAVSTDADEVFTFGRNDHGQLGLGDHRDRLVPCKVDALKTRCAVLSLGCGQYHTAVAQEDGLRVCGKNDYGGLCCCVAALLCCCVVVLLCCCVVVLLCCCVAVLLCCCLAVLSCYRVVV